MMHLRHYRDGYPLCWTMDQTGHFDGTFMEEDVNCDTCLKILLADDVK